MPIAGQVLPELMNSLCGFGVMPASMSSMPLPVAQPLTAHNGMPSTEPCAADLSLPKTMAEKDPSKCFADDLPRCATFLISRYTRHPHKAGCLAMPCSHCVHSSRQTATFVDDLSQQALCIVFLWLHWHLLTCTALAQVWAAATGGHCLREQPAQLSRAPCLAPQGSQEQCQGQAAHHGCPHPQATGPKPSQGWPRPPRACLRAMECEEDAAGCGSCSGHRGGFCAGVA